MSSTDVNPPAVSLRNLEALARAIEAGDPPIAFLAGGGISTAKAAFPRTNDLLGSLIAAAVDASPELRQRFPVTPVLDQLGFELVLNDLRQICPAALAAFFGPLQVADEGAHATFTHAFLGERLKRRDIVLTLNYDRLIERTWNGPVRFDKAASDATGFHSWESDAERGGVLFKLHGSLSDSQTCLGALEDVGTVISGSRRDLVSAILGSHIVCVVGWRASDPDLPPLVRSSSANRPATLPLYWIHHSASSVDRMSPFLLDVALSRPIYGDADDIFRSLDSDGASRRRLEASAQSVRKGLSAARLEIAGLCSESGMARFVGIALRRNGHEASAVRAFRIAAAQPAATPRKVVAASEERALTIWGHARGRVRGELVARQLVAELVGRTPMIPDSASGAETAGPVFGLLSMTVSASKHRRHLLLRVPSLFPAMRRSLAAARMRGDDPTDIAIREALTELYQGRFRLALVGDRAFGSRRLANWALVPFRRARQIMEDLPERSLHARFEVLAGYTLAAARLRACDLAEIEFGQLDRLASLLSDPRRLAYWQMQREEILSLCASLSALRATKGTGAQP